MTSRVQRLMVMVGAVIAGVVTVFGPAVCAEAPTGRFRVEHRVRTTEPNGETFVGPVVTDYYGPEFIVSQQIDGGRTVIDLVQGQLTGVDSDRGTYWRLSIDRFGELRRRIDRATRPASRVAAAAVTLGAEPEIVVEELAAARTDGAPIGAIVAQSGHRATVPGPAGKPVSSVEIWTIPTYGLSPKALDAVTALERALGSGDNYLDACARAIRDRTGGAFAVQTVRRVATPSGERVTEDVVSLVEAVPVVPDHLVAVPEGLRRIPHPMERIAGYLEDEAELRRAMSGLGGER